MKRTVTLLFLIMLSMPACAYKKWSYRGAPREPAAESISEPPPPPTTLSSRVSKLKAGDPSAEVLLQLGGPEEFDRSGKEEVWIYSHRFTTCYIGIANEKVTGTKCTKDKQLEFEAMKIQSEQDFEEAKMRSEAIQRMGDAFQRAAQGANYVPYGR